MKNKIIIFEEIYDYMRLIIFLYFLKGFQIYYYRINNSCKEKPWVKKYIGKNVIFKIDDKYNILYSALGFYPDLAYENIDKICNFLFKEKEIVRHLINLYKDERIYNVFKRNLLGELHRFYYINYILYKLNEFFPDSMIYLVYTLKKEWYRNYIIDIEGYYNFKDLVLKSGAFHYENKNIIFPLWFRILCRIFNWRRFLAAQAKSVAFIIWSVMSSFFNIIKDKNSIKKNYKFGITIVNPERQFANKIRKVDFLIDGENIKKGNTLFICWKKLSSRNRYYMKQNNLDFTDSLLNKVTLASTREIVPIALYLFTKTFKYRKEIFVIESALLQLACFAIWESFKEKYQIENLVSHCDFGPQSLARNLLLSKENTKTWYYIDAINWNNFFFTDSEQINIPKYNHAIGFLTYDYVLSWSDNLIEYFKIHHQDVKDYINIGCLWSQHIRKIAEGKFESNLKDILFKKGFKNDYKLISVFDSTYIDSTITTYEDGINFLKGIYRLLVDMPNIFILFKEKKPRKFVKLFSQGMLSWFKKLENHPRCYLPLREMNTSEAIAFSDLTISFPFTSATFEALCARKKALYYDASDKFRGAFYDKVPGLVCHSYEELLNRTKKLIFDISDAEYNKYLDEFVKGKIEPYLDGEGLTRFRQLLTNSEYSLEEKIKAGVSS